MTDVAGKRVLITGAASGIGAAVARKAAKRGAQLFLTDIQAEPLEAIAGELGAEYRALDITDVDAVKAWADSIDGSMDIVMNVAGISAWGSVETLEHHHWRSMVEVNLMGPIHVIEAFIPPMIQAGRGGHLVNVSSAAGLIGMPWHAAYSASKFGLRGVSEVLRFDLRRHGIKVSLVVPGGVDTPLVRTVQIAGVDQDDPRIQKFVGRFRAHAKAPEQVAGSILRGVERNRYMVYTSPDIWVGHFFQRKFALPYELAMRVMNDVFVRVVSKAPQRRAEGGSGAGEGHQAAADSQNGGHTRLKQ